MIQESSALVKDMFPEPMPIMMINSRSDVPVDTVSSQGQYWTRRLLEHPSDLGMKGISLSMRPASSATYLSL